MHALDWIIVIGLVSFITVMAVRTRLYTRSVADFLSANRCAGRYMLSIAQEISGMGAMSFVAAFEMYYVAGFVATWWGVITFPLWLLISVSGWIVYRFRETRAFTMAQLMELRYSRRFRIFFGTVAWLSGLIAFGIGPAVGTRFFLHFCGLPENFLVLGIQAATYPTALMVLISLALFFALVGGQISVMITDFLQGMFCNLAFLVILAMVLLTFRWEQIIDTLKLAPAHASLLNPYKTGEIQDFNFWFFVITSLTSAYMYMSWQGTQGFNCAAKSPHEAQMAKIIGTWRGLIQSLLIMMLPICAYTVMHHPVFHALAEQAQTVINAIADPQIQKQMTVPIVLAQILPSGLLGMFTAVMLAGFISSHNSGLHSWGSIFIQDVVLPLRQKPFTPRQHLWLLRGSIAFVAVYIYFFSLLFKQVEYLYMFASLTGAIFSGAGAAIIGGLYWKRGTTAGAWCGIIVGGSIAASGFLLQQFWPRLVPGLLALFPDSACLKAHADRFPLNGVYVGLIAVTGAILSYVGPSLYAWLIRRRPPFDLERMLHRGKYALPGEHADPQAQAVTGWRAMLPTPEFTRGDRLIYWASSAWILLWFVVLVVATIWNFTTDVSDDAWATFWYCKLMLSLVLGVSATVWFLIGGLRDMRDLFRTLRTVARNDQDNGRVVNHHNMGESK